MTDPAPLTPPDCDLRSFTYFPLDIGRFRDSELVTEESAEAIVAALLLWGVAWHQVPAASVPDNDKWLAKAAGYGRSVAGWMAVREGALRGFVKCSDGRLYNRTLAEKANHSWNERLRHNWQKSGDRHRKSQRDIPEAQRTKFPEFDDWKAGLKPESSGGNDLFSGGNEKSSGGNPAEKPLKGIEGKGIEGNHRVGANAPTARGGDFPQPEWADDQVWADFLKNRKQKRLVNTVTSYKRFVDDLTRLTTERWSPAKLLEHAVGAGWGGIYAPPGHPLSDRSGNGGANRQGSGAGAGDTRDGFERAADRRMGRD